MRKPMPYGNRTPAAGQILAAFRQVVQPTLSLKLQNTFIRDAQVWDILAYASVQRCSLEASCAEVPGAPSGNRLREVVLPALPRPSVLQGRLNAALRLVRPGETMVQIVRDLLNRVKRSKIGVRRVYRDKEF